MQAQGCHFHRIITNFVCQGGDIARGTSVTVSTSPSARVAIRHYIATVAWHIRCCCKASLLCIDNRLVMGIIIGQSDACDDAGDGSGMLSLWSCGSNIWNGHGVNLHAVVSVERFVTLSWCHLPCAAAHVPDCIWVMCTSKLRPSVPLSFCLKHLYCLVPMFPSCQDLACVVNFDECVDLPPDKLIPSRKILSSPVDFVG